jgi:hypothetical protein
MKKAVAIACSLLFMVLGLAALGSAADDDHPKGTQGSWKGEIVDIACNTANHAKGAGHAGCAKKCVKSGQPMGLLLDDGDIALLAADHKDGAAFEAAKDLAGSRAEVIGSLAEAGGIKVITVQGVKAAS